MQYKGVIFDLDGTLFHSIEDIADAVNKGLTDEGLAIHPVENYISWIGNGAYKLVERALPKGSNEEQIQSHLDKFLQIYSKNWNIKSRVFDGIPDVLNFFNRERIPISILSNKPHFLTMEIAGYYFQSWNFACVFGQRDGIPRKPDPQSAIEITTMCALRPDEFLYIGDSETDMKTAMNAGMLPIGVTWGYGSRQSVEESGAKYIVDKPGELIKIIQTLKN